MLQQLQTFAKLLGSKRFGLFRAPNTSCALVAHFAVLLTFGVAYPPLALIIGVYFYTTTWTWQSLLGRLLDMPHDIKDARRRLMRKRREIAARGRGSQDVQGGDESAEAQLVLAENSLAVKSNSLFVIIANVETQCADIWEVLFHARYILIVAAGIFYSTFLVDITGDWATHEVNVLWVPLSMVVVAYIVGTDKVKLWRDTRVNVAKAIELTQLDKVGREMGRRFSSAGLRLSTMAPSDGNGRAGSTRSVTENPMMGPAAAGGGRGRRNERQASGPPVL